MIDAAAVGLGLVRRVDRRVARVDRRPADARKEQSVEARVDRDVSVRAGRIDERSLVVARDRFRTHPCTTSSAPSRGRAGTSTRLPNPSLCADDRVRERERRGPGGSERVESQRVLELDPARADLGLVVHDRIERERDRRRGRPAACRRQRVHAAAGRPAPRSCRARRFRRPGCCERTRSRSSAAVAPSLAGSSSADGDEPCAAAVSRRHRWFGSCCRRSRIESRKPACARCPAPRRCRRLRRPRGSTDRLARGCR